MDSFIMDSSGTRLAVAGATTLGLLFLASAAYLAKPPTITVAEDLLVIRNTVYGRQIREDALRLDEARIIDISKEAALVPTFRTNGVAIFKYRTGWFRLRDGEKALVFLGSGKNVLYVPTAEGYALMFDTPDAEKLLDSIMKLRRR